MTGARVPMVAAEERPGGRGEGTEVSRTTLDGRP